VSTASGRSCGGGSSGGSAESVERARQRFTALNAQLAFCELEFARLKGEYLVNALAVLSQRVQPRLMSSTRTCENVVAYRKLNVCDAFAQ
jgi:hypothetical protein